MYANITVTLRHETGRTETIPNVRTAKHDTESTIVVKYILTDVSTEKYVVDNYDGLEWEIESVRPTEIPPSKR